MAAPVVATVIKQAAPVLRESVLKFRKYNSLTNREISRVKDNITKRATGILQDPTASSQGANQYFKMIKRFEKVVEDAGMSTKQMGSNLKKIDENIHKSFVQELKKFDSSLSLTRRSARKQAKHLRDFLGSEKHDDLTDEEKTRFWNTVSYYSSTDFGMSLDSDQILNRIREQMDDSSTIDIDFFDEARIKKVDHGGSNIEIYKIDSLENKMARTNASVEKIAERHRIDSSQLVGRTRNPRNLSF